jgi:hypothetical protein
MSTAIRLPRLYEPGPEVGTWFSIDPQPASISATINISIVFICLFPRFNHKAPSAVKRPECVDEIGGIIGLPGSASTRYRRLQKRAGSMPRLYPLYPQSQKSQLRPTYSVQETLIRAYVHDMESHDENKEALEQVEKATESEPAKSKDLLESEDLERKVGDSKKRITDENTSRPTS